MQAVRTRPPGSAGVPPASGPKAHSRRPDEGPPVCSSGRDARAPRKGTATLSSRRIDWFGFSPRITLRHERRDSNLDLYDYTRTVGEFSLIRTF